MLLLACTLSFAFISFAQVRKISGTVKDDKGVPLSGATVQIKGTKTATATNANGMFSIELPSDANTLVVSYVGMVPSEVTVGNRSVIQVNLTPTAVNLGNVVVIGYGTQRRRDVNGAISSVTAKDIQNIPQPSIDQMLQGKAAGVTITLNSGAPGASVSVRVRGITSFTGSEPLYVVDGVAIDGNAPAQLSSKRTCKYQPQRY
jgi:hypothetical protein